jgi:hypothetical protein
MRRVLHVPFAVVMGLGGFVSALKAEPPAAVPATEGVEARPSESAAALIVIRPASDSYVQGYERMTVGDGDVVYVSPEVAATGADLLTGSTQWTEGSDQMRIRLRFGEAVKRFGAPGSRLAVFVDGHLMAAPVLGVPQAAGIIELGGLLPGQAQRLSRVMMAAADPFVGPTFVLIPRESAVAPGAVALVDVFLTGVQELRAYQVALDMVGSTGRLDLEEMTIDGERTDYVFYAQPAVNASDMKLGRVVNAMFSGGVPIRSSAYLATFRLRASDDAKGRFELRVRSNSDTLLRDASGSPVNYNAGLPVEINVGLKARSAEPF